MASDLELDRPVIYGAYWCPDCRRSKAFLTEHRVEFHFVDLEEHPEATSIVERINGGSRTIPTILFPDGTHLSEPSNEELAEKLGLVRAAEAESYDLVIVGGGPTGLTAAIYAARENLRTVVIERSAMGGQAGITERFDNYPGFPEGISGTELASRFAAQAKRYGVELLPAVGVTAIEPLGNSLNVSTSTGQQISAGAVLIATGSTYRRTGADGEADLIGSGVHFCATCDGPFYKGANELVVLGGGNSGLEEGLFLTQFADHVTVVERDSSLRASLLLQDKVARHPQMSVLTNTATEAFIGGTDGRLTAVRLRMPDGALEDHAAQGAFVFIGLDPNTSWLPEGYERDPGGFLVTDRMMQTNEAGVFVAGDVRSGSTKQLAAAVGEGAAVAIQIRYYLDQLRGGQ